MENYILTIIINVCILGLSWSSHSPKLEAGDIIMGVFMDISLSSPVLLNRVVKPESVLRIPCLFQPLQLGNAGEVSSVHFD